MLFGTGPTQRGATTRSSPAISGPCSIILRRAEQGGERLFHLRQGTRSAQDFALDFWTFATGAGWNDRALIDHYRCSLREDVRRELACRDTTLSLDELIDLSIQLDHLLAARGRSERVLLVPPPDPPVPIPMELGGAASREIGGGSSSCTSCGRRGHTFRSVLEEFIWESRGQAEHSSVTPGESTPHSPRVSCWSHVFINMFP
jgi:hypothetical protein